MNHRVAFILFNNIIIDTAIVCAAAMASWANLIPIPTRVASAAAAATTTTVVKQRRYQGRRYFLQHAVLPSTQQRYSRSVDEFLAWIDDDGGDALTVDELDDLLLDYIHQLYEDGRGRTVASTTIFGILLRMPQLKYQLHQSHQAIRAWNRLVPASSYPPLSWELAVVIAVQMARAGYHRYGIGVLLAFDGLLRVSELCNLMSLDIAFDGDTRSVEHKGTMVVLRSTKTGKNQWVMLHDPSVIRLVRWLVSQVHQPAITVTNTRPSAHFRASRVIPIPASTTISRRSGRQRAMSSIGAEAVVYADAHRDLIASHRLLASPSRVTQCQSMAIGTNRRQLVANDKRTCRFIASSSTARPSDVRLFPFKPHQFRRVLKAICINLGLSDRYVPHSLRHGGATRYHHVLGWSIEDVLARGRWQSVKSARRYIQSGPAMLMSMDVPKNISDIATIMAHDPYQSIMSLSQEHS